MAEPVVITSTADLTPAGVLGYTKALAALVSAVLVVVVPFFPVDSTWAHWIQGAIALCGAIAVFALPNPVRPVTVHAPETP